MAPVASPSGGSGRRRRRYKRRSYSTTTTASKFRTRATVGMLALLLLALVGSLGIIAFTMGKGEEMPVSYEEPREVVLPASPDPSTADSTPTVPVALRRGK